MSAKFQVCPECEGHGTHDNRNFNGFTAADREEWDDFDESYRGGWMSVTCELCKGVRVVTQEQIEEFEYRQEVEAEYRAESLGYALGY